ncbi:hypothetical protein [Coleofasciculus sp. H7-2]|uniref:hypothetical protein n=1 Tax=Coleofasciculus sp. H7-2 TaxID=3351545 RepID=UPI00366E500C
MRKPLLTALIGLVGRIGVRSHPTTEKMVSANRETPKSLHADFFADFSFRPNKSNPDTCTTT